MASVDPVSRLMSRRSLARGPVILMYHSITPPGHTPESPWAVPLDRFREQVDYLVDGGWDVRNVSDLAPGTPGLERSVAITFDDGYRDNLPACEALEARGVSGTWFVVSGNVGRPAAWPDAETTGRPMLSAAELRDMRAAGMEVGGHTRSHVRLAEVPPDAGAEEVRGCREDLEDLLGEPVTSFAYPYGSHDDGVVSAVEDAGFQVACTTVAGPAFQDADPLRLRRVAVYGSDPLAMFARKLGLARNVADWPRVVDSLLHRRAGA